MTALPLVAHQRAFGSLRLSVKRRDAATVLDGLRQEGCLKARFPRTEPGPFLEAVTLNSAGGVAAGDRLHSVIDAAPGTALTVASQAAERYYRALPGTTATVTTRLEAGSGATLEWLPQETILFDGCALDRHLDIHLAADAAFTGLEMLVFGRTAMAEEVHTARLYDRITLRRAGRLVLHDAIRLDGAVSPRLARRAVGGGARAVATLLHQGAEPKLEALRDALAPFEAGVSQVDGLLIARILAPTGAELRRGVIAGLNILRAGRTLPRVWLC